jgi:hypothetical protein
MNVLPNPKGKCWALESEFLEAFMSNFTQIFEARVRWCCRHLFFSHRLIQNKQRNNCEAIEMMARKVHVCTKNWEFHLVTRFLLFWEFMLPKEYSTHFHS